MATIAAAWFFRSRIVRYYFDVEGPECQASVLAWYSDLWHPIAELAYIRVSGRASWLSWLKLRGREWSRPG